MVEDPKTAIFVRGNSTSENVRLAMKELVSGNRYVSQQSRLEADGEKSIAVLTTALVRSQTTSCYQLFAQE